MRILKKSLACLLVAIMAATAMFGCLVSAAELTGTISASAPDAYAGDTSITIPVTITPSANVYITRIKATSTLGAIASATVTGENVKTLEATDTNLESGIILIEASTEAGYASATVNLVFEKAEGFAAGTYSLDLENITTIEGSDWDENGVEYTVTGTEFELGYPYGSEQNPCQIDGSYGFMMNAQYFGVDAGATVYVKALNYSGMNLYIPYATGAYTIAYNGATYESADDFTATVAMVDGIDTLTITNNGAELINVRAGLTTPPVEGSAELHKVITENGAYVADMEGITDGYFYDYVATADGTVTVTMTDAENWQYVVSNVTQSTSTEMHWSDDATVVASETIDVVAGDKVTIVVTPYYHTASTTTVNWTFTFVEAVPEEIQYISYDSVKYDIATSKIAFTYTGNVEYLKPIMTEHANAGNRKVYLIVTVGETEFAFETQVGASGTLYANGFAFPHVSKEITFHVRITSNLDSVFNSNAYEMVIIDYVNEQYANGAYVGDELAVVENWLNMYNAWNGNTENIVLANATVEEGYVPYSSISYVPATSALSIVYGTPSQELRQIMTQYRDEYGNRSVKLIANIGGTEFAFDVSFGGGGTLTVSGFSWAHFTSDVEVYVRITAGANSEYVTETNSVTVNFAEEFATNAESAFAAAYNSYAN